MILPLDDSEINSQCSIFWYFLLKLSSLIYKIEKHAKRVLGVFLANHQINDLQGLYPYQCQGA